MNNINYKIIGCVLCSTLLIFNVGCSSSEPYFSSQEYQSDDTYTDESTDNNIFDNDSNSDNDTLNQDDNLTENNTASYDNYIGNWGYTIQYWQYVEETGEKTMPSESSWDLTIHSIKGNNIVFDYTAYASAGGATLGTENKNIESTIDNDTVEFTCYSSNLSMSDAPKEEITVKFYFKDGSIYVESDGSPVKLIKGGKTEEVIE